MPSTTTTTTVTTTMTKADGTARLYTTTTTVRRPVNAEGCVTEEGIPPVGSPSKGACETLAYLARIAIARPTMRLSDLWMHVCSSARSGCVVRPSALVPAVFAKPWVRARGG